MEPNIKKYFNEKNLIKQDLYKSKIPYKVLYINEELYEKYFDEKFNYDNACKNIIDKFSVTLDKSKGVSLIGNAYVDKQEDPLGMSLSGNSGSGRAFFFEEHFNIKGDKTILATSKNKMYNNGKYPLPAALKSAVLSNVLNNDLVIPTYQTLAILDTGEIYEFEDQYLDYDNQIKSNKYKLPCALEIRINEDKELYRISNFIIDNKTFNEEDIYNLIDNIAKLEANKFANRFLHGSWSMGNISTNCNLIDFDTSCFVKDRHPQYSNTNKYKSTYFGFELEGWMQIIKHLSRASDIDVKDFLFKKYDLYLKEEFICLLGLDKYKEKIDNNLLNYLFETFLDLSKLFTNNYNGVFVYNEESENTAIFDFSNFFQKYLLLNNRNVNYISGNTLLFNELAISEKYPEMTKEKINLYFNYLIVENEYNLIVEVNKFIKSYAELFKPLTCEELEEVKFKQYVINEDRYYLSGTNNLFYLICELYQDERIDNKQINLIINYLIKSNFRRNKDNFIFDLKINDEGISFVILYREHYNIVFIPFIEANFAKYIIGNKEYHMKHTEISGFSAIITDDIKIENINELNLKSSIIINGKISL